MRLLLIMILLFSVSSVFACGGEVDGPRTSTSDVRDLPSGSGDDPKPVVSGDQGSEG